MSETTVPAIDLDTTVTREQYISAVESLLPVLDQVSNDRGWCSERHRYFRAVMHEYVPDSTRYEHAGADFSQVPEDTDYADRLRSMRARVLWYVRNDTISPEIGDRILTGLGLRLANQAQKPGERVRAHIDVELNVAPGDSTARNWAEFDLPALIVRVLDASPDAGRYIPGSGVASCYSTDRLSSRASIPETDTERPSYR